MSNMLNFITCKKLIRGPSWTLVAPRGPLWTLVDPRGPSWPLVDPRGKSSECLTNYQLSQQSI